MERVYITLINDLQAKGPRRPSCRIIFINGPGNSREVLIYVLYR